jgi:hypothetical protein
MPFLGVKEAADIIRDKVRLSHMEPHDVHQLVFLKSVADELGLSHEPEVITHIAGLLREHDIQIHAGHEYPKWIGKGTAAVIVNNEDEDKQYRDKFPVDDTPDEPVPPAPTRDGHFDRSVLDDSGPVADTAGPWSDKTVDGEHRPNPEFWPDNAAHRIWPGQTATGQQSIAEEKAVRESNEQKARAVNEQTARVANERAAREAHGHVDESARTDGEAAGDAMMGKSLPTDGGGSDSLVG